LFERLIAELDYSWKPFVVDGLHLTFRQHVSTRLESHRCSHWGPAVYKWEGPINDGPHAGQVGVLIGETSDLRQRIKQYVSGTQERGNKLWREGFLSLGDVRLYALSSWSLAVASPKGARSRLGSDALASANARLVLEQLLVMRAVSDADESIWVVNARQ
jgi:hypothetical protein